jgi:uncharacterized protein YdcH (DUF465 family)
MSHVPHELAADFPESVQVIHRLKMQDAHFARLAERYHELNRQIHRAETLVEPMEDEALEHLKRERVHLKDELSGMISRAA